MHHFEMWGDGWYFFPVTMFIFMLIVMAIFIIIFYRRRAFIFNRSWFRQNWDRDWFTDCCGIDKVKSANDILEKRYARGEINKEKYEQMKRDISDTK